MVFWSVTVPEMSLLLRPHPWLFGAILLACAPEETPQKGDSGATSAGSSSVSDTCCAPTTSTTPTTTGVPSNPLLGNWSIEIAETKFHGGSTMDVLGCRVDATADADGDGLNDVAMSSPRQDAGGNTAGAVYVFYGVGTGDYFVDDDADLMLLGEEVDDFSGYAMSFVGDVNQDGFADILVGARSNDAGGIDAGAAYLLYSPAYGVIGLEDSDAIFIGEAAGDEAGRYVDGIGDNDGGTQRKRSSSQPPELSLMWSSSLPRTSVAVISITTEPGV
jgi:hypothetical protein